VREELGVEVQILSILDSYGGTELAAEYPNGDRVSYVTTAYLCRALGTPVAAEPAEVSSVGWFLPAEILGLQRFEWIDHVVADAVQRLNSARSGDTH
jgi:hypothetical protein